MSIKPTADGEIQQICIPQEACIPLLQDRGTEAEPVVALGEIVREGQLIGYSTNGSAVHASIPGLVSGIDRIQLPNTQVCTAVSIKLGGSFNFTGKDNEEHNWKALSHSQIIELIQQKGLVQLDGSTEGLAQVLSQVRERSQEQEENPVKHQIIVNAAFGTPYLLSEAIIFNRYRDKIITALEILQSILANPDVHLVCTKHAQSQIFKAQLESRGIDIRVHSVPERYPEGSSEYIQSYSQKKKGQSSTIFTVSTLLAIYEAVVLRKGLIERIITLGGSALGKSVTVKVRIGTPLSTVLQEIGGLQSHPTKIIVGLPIQGHIVSDINSPVTKHMSSVFALSEDEIGEAQEMPCIHCGKCVEYCPAGIEPVILHKLIQNNSFAAAKRQGLDACWFCGICSHVCPSHIPLTTIMKEGRIRSMNGAMNGGQYAD